MKLAIASGRGRTGKTTVATNLAWVAARSGHKVAYINCALEEPKGHLLLHPRIRTVRPLGYLHAQIDGQRCTYCGLCGEACQHNAIIFLGTSVLVYPEFCRACEACRFVCPSNAITATFRNAGQLSIGTAGRIDFISGALKTGEVMNATLLRQVKEITTEATLQIMDCPSIPSGMAVESLQGSDMVLLISEPTAPGLDNLSLAIEILRSLKLRCSVVINRAGSGSEKIMEHCHRNHVAVVGEIMKDRRVPETHARGIIACEVLPRFRHSLVSLLDAIIDTHPVRSVDVAKETAE